VTAHTLSPALAIKEICQFKVLCFADKCQAGCKALKTLSWRQKELPRRKTQRVKNNKPSQKAFKRP
jgi:hypothetical protein